MPDGSSVTRPALTATPAETSVAASNPAPAPTAPPTGAPPLPLPPVVVSDIPVLDPTAATASPANGVPARHPPSAPSSHPAWHTVSQTSTRPQWTVAGPVPQINPAAPDLRLPQPRPATHPRPPDPRLPKPLIMDPPEARPAANSPQSFPSPNVEHASRNPKFANDVSRMTHGIQQSLAEAVRRAVRDNFEKCLLGTDFHQAFLVSPNISLSAVLPASPSVLFFSSVIRLAAATVLARSLLSFSRCPSSDLQKPETPTPLLGFLVPAAPPLASSAISLPYFPRLEQGCGTAERP